MATCASDDVVRAITCTLQTRPGLSMDDLILSCLPYSWSQIFVAVNGLLRRGVVRHGAHGGFFINSGTVQPIMRPPRLDPTHREGSRRF